MVKNLIVTGSSSGLGLAICIAAAKAGYKVHATMRDTSKRDRLAAAATAASVSVNVVSMDVENTASVEAAIGKIVDEDGGLHGLINNAGVGYVRTTEQASEADINWVMNVNFMGVMRCTKAVLPHMRKARAGRIINITSVGGLVGQPFNEIYCASKFAVEGYTEALASYVGPAFGLHFTAVEPGGIASEFAASAMKQFAATGGMIEDEYAPVIAKYMAGIQARAKDPGHNAYQTSEQVADVVLKCLMAEHPPVRIRTSKWSEEFTKLKTSADPDGLKLQAHVVKTMLAGL
jgi:NAD(P)-dependent dehydrogenase (short-subunit alcohol dehydrogenase family)